MVSEKFKESSIYWKNILQTYKPDHLPQEMSLRWSRRWSLFLLGKPELKIDINIWVSSIMDKIPLDWSELYDNGFITSEEASIKMWRIYADKLAVSQELELHDFPKVPSAFYDNHGLVSKAKDLLQDGPGILVVGADNTVRKDLVRILTGKVDYSLRFNTLEVSQSGEDGYLVGTNTICVSPGMQAKPKLYSYLGNIPEKMGGPAWHFDTEDNILGPIADVAIDFFEQIVELKKEDNIRFVIALKPTEIQTLSELVPAVKSLPVLEVPPVDPKDLIPYFFSYLPEVLDSTKCSLPLGVLLNFLYQASQSDPEFLSPDNAGVLPSYVYPDKEDFGMLSTAPFGKNHKRPFSFIPMHLKRIPRRNLRKILGESEGFFKSYIGGLENLEELIHIYRTVDTLRDSDLLELNLTRYGTEKELLEAFVASKKSRICPITGKEYRVDPSTGKEFSLSPNFKVISSYDSVIKSLPRPTPVQTAQFAAHVADAHSWYKHLPLYPKTPIYFYLDPTAGMKFERDEDDNVRYVEETNPKGFHYTHMTTKEYRERFGHWKYHIDRGHRLLDPMVLLNVGLNDASVTNLETKIQGINGESLIVPPRLFNKGKTYISAFVHENSPIHLWMDYRPRMLRNKYDKFQTLLAKAPEELDQNLQFVWALLNTEGWYSLNDNNPLIDRCFRDFLSDEKIPYGYWRDQDFLKKKAEDLGGIEHYAEALLAAETLRSQESRGRAVLREQEYHYRRQMHLKLLNEKDRGVLLKKWQDELSSASVDDALTTLLKEWENLGSTKMLMDGEFSEMDQEDKIVIEKLLQENLASGIKHLATNKAQKDEAHEIRYNILYKDESFSHFVEKHYPPTPAVTGLIDHLVRERVQQLDGMISAMNCFMDNVFHE